MEVLDLKNSRGNGISLPIPATLRFYVDQERDDILENLSHEDQSTPIEVCLLLLERVGCAQPSDEQHAFRNHLWNHVHDNILAGRDIHELTATEIDLDKQQHVLRKYLEIKVAIFGTHWEKSSMLIQEVMHGNVSINALFGGQGNTTRLLDELHHIWYGYNALVNGMFETITGELRDLANTPSIREQYLHGCDLLHWLNHPTSRPPTAYIVSAPLSFPLIGLLQLVRFKAVCMCLGITPADFPRIFSGLAGHSQGLLAAIAISQSRTWHEYHQSSIVAIKILFWIGARCQQVFDDKQETTTSLAEPNIADDILESSAMLSVTCIGQESLDGLITSVNRHTEQENHVHLSLINTPSDFVVSGSHSRLEVLKQSISGDSQSSSSSRFLPITIPCHSPLLRAAVPLIQADLAGIVISTASFTIPINSHHEWEGAHSSNAIPLIIQKIATDAVDWRRVAFDGSTHIVDFGPGSMNGVGSLANRQVVGSGTRVIIAGVLQSPETSGLGSLAELFSSSEVHRAPCWREMFSPQIQHMSNGLQWKTRLSQLLGLPPVFVAGMTPTTKHPEFVAAIMRAGYHVEFAAGGYHNRASLLAALYKLRGMIPVGRSIAINVIYASPKSIAWQIPLIKQLREEGYPIAGLTIGAGVPSSEVAAEYIATLDLEYIGFKPSSVASIQRVVEIAKENPRFSIILQWTGGRAGGHHSNEDFHEPILATYASIRARSNIILVAGSGFGTASDTTPYITGSWSLQHGKVAMMPFDGILLGSRIMACAEAHTSRGSKLAIVSTAGSTDSDWRSSYLSGAGGVVSVVSEMGEPIHVLATRGALLWAELDRTIFVHRKKKRLAALQEKRAYIITGLNADYQRPWFAQKSNGKTCELADMTYLEVLRRMVQLMFVGKWIDATYKEIFQEFLSRVQARLGQSEEDIPTFDDESLNRCPERILSTFESVAPLNTCLLCAEDEHYFLQLCQGAGLKPVPFIPDIVNDSFETWFKKDSLWQSEALETVVDQDAGRTFILHGPVAAQHSTQVDEPVGSVLNGIYRGILEQITDNDDLPSADAKVMIPSMTRAQLPEGLDASKHPAAATLLQSPSIFRDGSLFRNPLRKICETMAFQAREVDQNAIRLSIPQSEEAIIEIYEKERVIDVWVKPECMPTTMTFIALFRYEFCPETPYALIREISKGRDGRICDLYRKLWPCNAVITQPHYKLDQSTIARDRVSVVPSELGAFTHSIGYNDRETVPQDFLFVAAWSAISSLLLKFPTDLLRLLHLSNGFEIRRSAPIRLNDEMKAEANLYSIVEQPTGVEVTIRCGLCRVDEESDFAELHSRFLLRGMKTDGIRTFSKRKEPSYMLQLSSTCDVAVLDSKPWFKLTESRKLSEYNNLDLTKVTFFFELETVTNAQGVTTSGMVSLTSQDRALKNVGKVSYYTADPSRNEVLSYLTRHGRVSNSQDTSVEGSTEPVTLLRSRFTAPQSNVAYSRSSGDFNPIHTSLVLAHIAGLPKPVTHGMYCSAAIRQLLERHICDGRPEMIKAYNIDFVGMVFPGETIDVVFNRTGFQDGYMVIAFEARNQERDERVSVGSAKIAQPCTSIIFTGQGSAEKGMGMELYASSGVAREVWDRAERYFQEQLGISILQIVRQNPKTATVYFGGRRGRQLRRNYQAMNYETQEGGQPVLIPSFPDVTEHSTSFTHTSAEGLLYMTQFTQPALAIMEMAAFRDMQRVGVVPADHNFTGHSLGEYISLACSTDFMELESLLDLLFCRGMTIQSAVKRDALGRSTFSMVAVDPSRISAKFDEAALKELVQVLQIRTERLVEIVNFNARNRQYICAGDLHALHALQFICDDLRTGVQGQNIEETVARHVETVFKALPVNSRPSLSRGLATIPLTGVDVPFHSTFLRPRMEAMRTFLDDLIKPDKPDPEQLVGRYVPNLIGTAFSLERKYVEEVHAITGSKILHDVLAQWV